VCIVNCDISCVQYARLNRLVVMKQIRLYSLMLTCTYEQVTVTILVDVILLW